MNRELKEKHVRGLIEKMERELKEIYTVPAPEGYPSENKKKFDLREEMSNLEFYESIYSTVETEGVPEGEIYQEYSKYVSKIREAKAMVEKEKEKVEEKNSAQIKNANVLLKSFKEALN